MQQQNITYEYDTITHNIIYYSEAFFRCSRPTRSCEAFSAFVRIRTRRFQYPKGTSGSSFVFSYIFLNTYYFIYLI